MKDRVSAHSGLPESVELRMMAEKHETIKAKKESQIARRMDLKLTETSTENPVKK